MLLHIRQLMDDAKCDEVVRALRWPDGVKCPACDSGQINTRGFHGHQAHRQRYSCKAVLPIIGPGRRRSAASMPMCIAKH
jgi:hypothetical protein